MPIESPQAALWMILDWSVRASAVAVAVAAILRLSGTLSSANRHSAWTAVLAAMLLMPILTLVVPALGSPFHPPLASTHLPTSSAAVGERPVLPMDAEPAISPAPAGIPGEPDRGSVAGPSASSTRRSLASAWPVALLSAYALVALLMLARLFAGWLALRRIIRASQLVPSHSYVEFGFSLIEHNVRPSRIARDSGPSRITLRQCADVAVPVSTGVFARTILVPAAWHLWPSDTRRAVLAHELAHLRRRDALVMLLARVNRALFWFHPLAWWLERALAASAEEACDEVAVRLVGESRQYAQVLVEMARAVQRAGARVACHGVGIDGSGSLEHRIDHVLGERWRKRPGVLRQCVLALGCAAAVFAAAACREQRPEDRRTQLPDPKVAQEFVQEEQRDDFFRAAVGMTVAEAEAEEARLRANPEDFEARKRLGIFYRFSGQKVVGWNQAVAARRRHILWLIEHHPGHRVLLDWGPIYPAHDPEGYAQARRAWLAQAEKDPEDIDALGNAAYFFQVTDKPLAEEMLRRVALVDPGGPGARMIEGIYVPSTSARLAAVYAAALLGITEGSTVLGIRAVSKEESHDAYAQEVRRKLSATRDVALLTATAEELMHGGRGLREKLGYDPLALARTYLEQARELDPEAAKVRSLQVGMRLTERRERAHLLLRAVPRGSQVATILALPESDRLELLPWLAQERYSKAEHAEWTEGDRAAARAHRDAARRYANELLSLAPARCRLQECGTALFTAHLTLAALALHDGDTRGAVHHLWQANDAPPTEELRYGNSFLWMRVANGLLKRGEREAVAEFLEAYANVHVMLRKSLLEAAASVRNGVMPRWFQYQVSSSGGKR